MKHLTRGLEWFILDLFFFFPAVESSWILSLKLYYVEQEKKFENCLDSLLRKNLQIILVYLVLHREHSNAGKWRTVSLDVS